VHESESGTFRTCPATLTMSVDGGKADLAVAWSPTNLRWRLNNIPVQVFLRQAAHCDCQRANAGFGMCEKCVTIDKKTEHYERLCLSISDQLTIERIKTLIAEMKAEKAGFHPESSRPQPSK
jgi:hypothetical protein